MDKKDGLKRISCVNKELLFGEKKNTVEAKAWLGKHYSDSAPGKSTVEMWFAKFKWGEMSIENSKKFYKIFLNDRKVKLIEIAKTLNISKERVGHIVHAYLDMLKLCAKWVQRMLTINQKQQRVDES
jgi:hypothetical protein